MAPRTPEVMAKLEARTLHRAKTSGLEPASTRFSDWMKDNRPDPRGIPPSVVEAEIAHPDSAGIRVVLIEEGDVITVIPGRK